MNFSQCGYSAGKFSYLEFKESTNLFNIAVYFSSQNSTEFFKLFGKKMQKTKCRHNVSEILDKHPNRVSDEIPHKLHIVGFSTNLPQSLQKINVAFFITLDISNRNKQTRFCKVADLKNNNLHVRSLRIKTNRTSAKHA